MPVAPWSERLFAALMGVLYLGLSGVAVYVLWFRFGQSSFCVAVGIALALAGLLGGVWHLRAAVTDNVSKRMKSFWDAMGQGGG